MNGYLLQEKTIYRGEPAFIESTNPENTYAVVFEDDGETGYFYAIENNPADDQQKILDALHIYQVDEKEAEPTPLLIIWSRDWLKCALVLDKNCHAIFDFENQGGYNASEFPPPNGVWTKGTRTLTEEMVNAIFG